MGFLARTPAWCEKRARELRPATAAVAKDLLGINAPLRRLRSVQATIALAARYGAPGLEMACVMAHFVGDPSYRTARGIPDASRERLPEEPAACPTAPLDLHGPDTLFAYLKV